MVKLKAFWGLPDSTPDDAFPMPAVGYGSKVVISACCIGISSCIQARCTQPYKNGAHEVTGLQYAVRAGPGARSPVWNDRCTDRTSPKTRPGGADVEETRGDRPGCPASWHPGPAGRSEAGGKGRTAIRSRQWPSGSRWRREPSQGPAEKRKSPWSTSPGFAAARVPMCKGLYAQGTGIDKRPARTPGGGDKRANGA